MRKDSSSTALEEHWQTPFTLTFNAGTLIVSDWPSSVPKPEVLAYDERINAYRALAMYYRNIYSRLVRAGVEVFDNARNYENCSWRLCSQLTAFDHQSQALREWKNSGRCGVITLPTGSGKTFLAQLAIADAQRSTLVVVPTLDLLDQWSRTLSEHFGEDVGLLGGGIHEIRAMTVTTYDSAAIHMERLGNRFGLLVFDEVHHLPGEVYRFAAESSIAPYRLGLTATIERADGKHADIEHLVGRVVYSRSIKELSGDILAPYEAEVVEVTMSPDDLEIYTRARSIYLGFLRAQGISMQFKSGWGRFLAATSQSEAGRTALRAYYEQKQIALVHSRKLDVMYTILQKHADEKVLIFTNDNDSVYRISETLLCPVITHETTLKERREVLAKFREGSWRILVTSKVLNEGIDVPDASVAIILSGSASIREHVQRLGRILRRGERGKKAHLYELVTGESAEVGMSHRRRMHNAYE